MRTTWKKVTAGVLTVAMCLQAWTLNGGMAEAKTQDVYGYMEGIFLTEDGWYCIVESYAVAPKDGEEVGEEQEGIKICGYEGDEKDLIVPEKIDGKVVWGIEKAAFQNSDIRSIQLPETVIDFDLFAFDGCEELESVTTYECETKVNFDSHGGMTLPVVNSNAFSGCTNLKSITIPKEAEWICSSAFRGCKSLKEIVIPEGVTEIQQSAFASCQSLETIVIPDTVEEIGDYAFASCTGLRSIEFPKSLKNIGQHIMKNCTSLESVEIPGSVKLVNDGAFLGCTALKDVVILSGAEEIGSTVFENCTSLEHITIPATVHEIFNTAFDGCGEFTIHTTNATYAHHYAANNGINYVVADNVEDVYTQEDWQYTVLDDGIKIVYYTGTESQVEIPETIEGKPVTVISNMTFVPGDASENNTIKSITIPASVTTIGDSAFKNCCALENVIVPAGVTSIGESAFENCCKLQNVVIPGTVRYVGNRAFYNCQELKTVEIEDGKTSKTIGDSAFYDCSQLEAVYIYTYVYKIGKKVFTNCDKLTIYSYPHSNIVKYAEENNINFVTIPFPDDDDDEDEITITPTAEPTITGGVVSPAEPTKTESPTVTAEPTKAENPTVTAEPTKTENPTVTAVPTANPTVKATPTPTKVPDKVKAPKVKKVSGLKVSAKKKALVVSWKKLSDINGYQLQVSTKKNFKNAKTISINKSKKTYTASKLKSKKKYYVRIRAYKTYKLASGEKAKAYGTWKSINKKTK